MLNFASDYTEGAHEAILRRLLETNLQQTAGYGEDPYCAAAREKIRVACACPRAAVRFLAGGTQTNQIVIDTLLRPYEGVLTAETGHINCHEAGAIEFTGHKVLPLPSHQGKLDAGELLDWLDRFQEDGNREHTVFPGMVYVSHPTEYGTLYTRAELEELSAAARRHGLPLYLDGARLGYGLAAEGTDVDLPFLARVCDAFYIGGTKVGALLGEALVFPGGEEPPHFTAQIKQHGALLAKGRVLGLQFDTLFTDGLYFRLGQNGIRTALRLKAGLRDRDYRLAVDSPTNQQFLLLSDGALAALEGKLLYSFWEKPDPQHTVIRLATSWATTDEAVDRLLDLL